MAQTTIDNEPQTPPAAQPTLGDAAALDAELAAAADQIEALVHAPGAAQQPITNDDDAHSNAAPHAQQAAAAPEDDLMAAMLEIEHGPRSPKPAGAGGKGLKFKIGAKPGGQPSDAAPAAAAAVQAAASPAPAACDATELVAPGHAPRVTVGKRIYRVFDAAFEAISWPLIGARPVVQQVVGLSALTTIVLSLAVMFVVPLVSPNRDAVTFVTERRAAMEEQRRRAAEEAVHAAAADQPADGHDEPDSKDEPAAPAAGGGHGGGH